MKIELRNPNIVMKLSKLGSFHQSKLSFLRSFLKEFKDWDYNCDLFELDDKGYGKAVYSFKKNNRIYSLVCFANKINNNEIMLFINKLANDKKFKKNLKENFNKIVIRNANELMWNFIKNEK